MPTEPPIELAGQITSMSYRSDGGMRISFTTNEMSDSDKVTLSGYYNKFGYILFKPNRIQETDIPKEDAAEGGKTPSQRLRAVLFVYWQQVSEGANFEAFYRDKMEKLIKQIKGRLD